MPILRLLDRVAIAIAIAVSAGSMPVTAHAAEENIGKVSQPLVGGQVIDAQTQERYTLLTLSSGCSASLLRNEWVVTAAGRASGSWQGPTEIGCGWQGFRTVFALLPYTPRGPR